MPSPADKVDLLIGGQVIDSTVVGGSAHDDWQSYDIDSNLLTPADAWHLTLSVPTEARKKLNALPDAVTAGALIRVKVGGETVLTGRIDEITHEVDKRSHTLALSGRDLAAVLLDCSAPIFVARQVSLDEIIAKIVKPLGLVKHRIDSATARQREKVNVEPGDTAWEVLSNAAEANGLWPWFDPDGTLVVGGPDYTTAPVADLVMRYNGSGNNLLSVGLTRSVADRYSELTVLGQTHGTSLESGKHSLRGDATDGEMAAIAYRPKIVVDHECDSPAVARSRARKLIADARLKGFTVSARVKGHRIVAPGQAADGTLWKPGQRVRLRAEPHGLDGVFFLMGRRFFGGRSGGAITELQLKEDGIWTLDAHPHKRKHRYGNHGVLDDSAAGSAN